MRLNFIHNLLMFIVYTFQGPQLYFTKAELQRERKKIIDQAREINDKAEKENRNFSSDEDAKYGELMNKAEEFRLRIERQEKQEALDRTLAGIVDDVPAVPGEKVKIGRFEIDASSPRNRQDYQGAFRNLIRQGPNGLSAEQRSILAALQSDVDTAGGYAIVPEAFIATLIKAIDDVLFIRQRATVIPLTSAKSIGAPSLDADPEDGTWSGEIVEVNEDTAMKWGKRALTPHLVAKLIKVSKDLVQFSALDIVSIITQRLAYKFGVTQEKAYLTGNGVGQPLGIFVASALGIPTSRDVSDQNSATEPTADGLINAKYALKQGYWNNSAWIFHRDVMKVIAKLKGGDGQYMWRESVRAGEPDTLLGRPIMMSEFAPNTMTAGQYVGAFGDFSYYWIVDAVDFTIQALMELYARNNQNGYIGRYKGDGMPILGEAFVRVKLG